MSIVIHGINASPFVRKVRVALAEKNVPYELKAQIPFGQPPEYMKISPLGKIPCLQEGDFTLPDSSCIIAYLERTHPKPALYPENPQEYGRALFLEEYADSKLIETVGAVFFQRVVRKLVFKQESDETIVRNKIDAEAPKVFDWIESQIGDREWLVGGRFGIADIAMASPFVNFGHAGETVDAKRWPRLAAYLQRVFARPSFKGLIEEEHQTFKP
ncbi:MAG TPA: glutathione S-transferase family protein [Myxococcota bacterium]|jgi:glutathione S-transferase